MRKVLFSLGVLGLFANVDAMHITRSIEAENQRRLISSFIINKNMFIGGDMGELSRMSIRDLKRKFSKIYAKCQLYPEYQNIRSIYSSQFCSAHQLGAQCFRDLERLRQFIFGLDSNLESISEHAFAETQIAELVIPASVKELCYGCFDGCTKLRQIIFEKGSQVECIFECAFRDTQIEELVIPASVKELCYACFEGTNLRHVTFEEGSKLESIGKRAFKDTPIEEISIPDGVIELCTRCFEGTSLRRITFGIGSRLERVEAEAYEMDVHVFTPDNVLNIIQHSDLVRYNNLKQHISALTDIPIDSLRVSCDEHIWEFGFNIVLILQASVQQIQGTFPYWVVFEGGSQLQSVEKEQWKNVKQIFLLGDNWSQEFLDQLPMKPIKLCPCTTSDADAAGA